MCLLLSFVANAQQKDSSGLKSAIMDNNIFKFAMNAITKSDNGNQPDVLQQKMEKPFLPFDGKGIRSVSVIRYGFEKTFADTSNNIVYFGTKLLNSLHRNSREWVIRDNLFFKEKQTLDAYLLADNERYLRSLGFIQDVRIIVKPIANQPDSVDIVVISKDVFSISAGLNQLTPEKFRGKISDDNLAGMGQKLQVSLLLEKDRQPVMGYDIQYSKINIAGSFINGTVGYTSINRALAEGDQNEHGWYMRLERPLPYASALFAGAIGMNSYESSNNYGKPDSLFYSYKYHGYNIWLGHNMGAKQFLRNKSLQNRYFLSARYFNTHFKEIPYQFADSFDVDFNSKQALLGQFTFFRQRFYRTNYILDFGNTEDAPYGYNIAVVGGWYKQWYLSRPYGGIDANRYMVGKKGQLMQYYLRAGAFLHAGELQDAGVLVGAGMYSRLFLYRNLKIRQYFNFSYTRQFNRTALMPLRIDNDFGLQDFNIREITGMQRISFKSETSFYLRAKLLGFKFAPFVFGNAVLLTPEQKRESIQNLYLGLGGGVRTRNQNLVFGTMELRAIYFPRTDGMGNAFKIGINTNIRFRYNTTYVKAPDIVHLNADPDNKIN
jgi:hypothetical protein